MDDEHNAIRLTGAAAEEIRELGPERLDGLLRAARRLLGYDLGYHLETTAVVEEALRLRPRPLAVLLLDPAAPDVLFAPQLVHELARLRLLARGVFADKKTQQQARQELGRLADALALRQPSRKGRPPVAPFEELMRETVRTSSRALARLLLRDDVNADEVPPAVLPIVRFSSRLRPNLAAAARALFSAAPDDAPAARKRAAVHISRRWHELVLAGAAVTEKGLRDPLDGRIPWEAERAKARRKSRLLSVGRRQK